jgi:glycosyltransferase involved in cell wall biosynthesis
LVEDLLPELRSGDRRFEIVLVVEGKNHPARQEVVELVCENPDTVQAWVMTRSSGEAGALAAGFEKATNEIVVTTSSQPQSEPGEIDKLVEPLESSEVDMVVGRRYPRHDGLMPRLQTFFFHRLMRLLTGTRYRDLSCGLRAMRAETAADLRLYGKFHRFVAVLAESQGFEVEEVDVAHNKQDRPRGLYRAGSYLRRLLDILAVFFLVRFTKRPLRFFGVVGLALFIPGLLLTAYLGVYRLLGLGGIADRPLLLLAVLLLVAGIQILSVGLLGELIIFTYVRDRRDYRVAEIFEANGPVETSRQAQPADPP